MNLRKEFEYYFEKLNTNLCSFEKHYKNVENFYKLIQIGTRIKDANILIEKCWELISEPEYIGTPDFGGALCVIMYNDIKQKPTVYIEYLKDYLYYMNNNNPHCIRWAISLCYKMGELTNEEYWFKKCINYDWKKFNTLILTKQLLACEKIARIKLNKKNKDEAINYLILGIEKYKEGLCFDLDKTIGIDGHYIYFGCAEIAELSDIASQLIKFLQNIDIYGTKEFEQIFDKKRFGLLNYCKKLEEELGNVKKNN